MEILRENKKCQRKIKAAVFDFDGTISTLRCGWEKVMEPLMLEMIYNGRTPTPEQIADVKDYIDKSTGIQTILQMKYLNEKVKEAGLNPDLPDDPWFFKEEYNRRLMKNVAVKRREVADGKVDRLRYLIAGSDGFLQMLKDAGVDMYLASGTDEEDVRTEAGILGMAPYFTQISGAMPMSEGCSKEAAIISLIEQSGVSADELLVVGDGPVEIRLGYERGAHTIGVASDEEKLSGVNPVKRNRLANANADIIVGDFLELDALREWLNIK